MKLPSYIKTTSQAAFAASLGVSSGLVYQWLKGIRPVAAEQCVAIEQATKGQVTRKDLRPTDWHLIWPELIDKDLPPPPSS